jgi:hypothetical protein
MNIDNNHHQIRGYPAYAFRPLEPDSIYVCLPSLQFPKFGMLIAGGALFLAATFGPDDCLGRQAQEQ